MGPRYYRILKGGWFKGGGKKGALGNLREAHGNIVTTSLPTPLNNILKMDKLGNLGGTWARLDLVHADREFRV